MSSAFPGARAVPGGPRDATASMFRGLVIGRSLPQVGQIWTGWRIRSRAPDRFTATRRRRGDGASPNGYYRDHETHVVSLGGTSWVTSLLARAWPAEIS